MAANRIQRLKDLVNQLERLPASPERDRMLSEVRSRAVDLDTGMTPRAMLPLREPAPPPAPPKPPKHDRPRSVTRAAPWPPRALELAGPHFAAAASTDAERSLRLDDRLSLEDSPLPYVPARGDRAVPPWTLGLRG